MKQKPNETPAEATIIPCFFLFQYFHPNKMMDENLPTMSCTSTGRFFCFCFFFFFNLDAGWSSLELCHNRLPTYHLVRLLFPYKRTSPPGNRADVIWPTQKKKKKREKFNFQDFRILVPTFSVHIRRPHAHMALNDSHIYSRRDRGFIKGERKKRARKCIKIYFFF